MSPIPESWQEVNDTLSQRAAGVFIVIMIPLIYINSFLPYRNMIGYNGYQVECGWFDIMTHESFRVFSH